MSSSPDPLRLTGVSNHTLRPATDRVKRDHIRGQIRDQIRAGPGVSPVVRDRRGGWPGPGGSGPAGRLGPVRPCVRLRPPTARIRTAGKTKVRRTAAENPTIRNLHPSNCV